MDGLLNAVEAPTLGAQRQRTGRTQARATHCDEPESLQRRVCTFKAKVRSTNLYDQKIKLRYCWRSTELQQQKFY
jgi:hypothetical protein